MTKPKDIDFDLISSLVRYDPCSGEFYAVKKFGKRWPGQKINLRDKNGYKTIELFGSAYFAHRIAWAIYYREQPPEIIDHANQNRADNRIENLRAASRSQNMANQGARASKNGIPKGVSWCKRRGMWVAKICVNGKRTFLGAFKKMENAEAEYKRIAESAFGEFSGVRGDKK